MEGSVEISNDDILANLKTAKERLTSAEVLLKAGQFRDSVSRSYYAFLDAATAALLARGIITKSHSAVYKMFALHLVKSRLVSEKYGRWLNIAFKSRLEADYEKRKAFDRKDAKEALKEAKEFVKVIEELLLKLLGSEAR